MATDYNYSDVDKSLAVDSFGNVKILYDEDVIIQSIKMLIGGYYGEYVRSGRGSRIIEYLGRSIQPDTADDIKDELIRLISDYETRVQIIRIVVFPNPDQNKYDIEMNLRMLPIGRSFIFNTGLRALSVG